MAGRVREKIVKLNGIYSELLRLAKEKTEFLKGSDYEAVGSITEKEEKEIELARETEKARMECVEELARTWGISSEKVSAAVLIGKCGTKAEAEEMAEAVKALSTTLSSLKAQNEINARLLDIKLRMASFILDASRVTSNDPGNYYNMDGTEQEKDALSSPRFIDSEI